MLKVLVALVVLVGVGSVSAEFKKLGVPKNMAQAQKIQIVSEVPEGAVNLGYVSGSDLFGEIEDIMDELKADAFAKYPNVDVVYVPESAVIASDSRALNRRLTGVAYALPREWSKSSISAPDTAK